jgi:hypothetical protein
MNPLLPGRVAWYATGRFYVTEDRAVLDAGYFLHLDPLADSNLFAGDPGEATAHFTFLATPFQVTNMKNGDLTLGVDPVGDFSIYFAEEPCATFDDPQSFGQGEPIARFRRVSVVVGVTVESSVTTNVFSAALIESRPFTFRGRTYDLGEALPHGITQWGIASTEVITPPPQFLTVLPFVGSAIAVG